MTVIPARIRNMYNYTFVMIGILSVSPHTKLV